MVNIWVIFIFLAKVNDGLYRLLIGLVVVNIL